MHQWKQNTKKKNTAQNKNASIPKCVALAPYAVSLCPGLEGNLAGRAAAKDFDCSPRTEGRTECVLCYFMFFFLSELSEGEKKRKTCWAHRLNQLDSGNSQWSLNGTTTSPGPWKPLVAPLTLWPSEHSDMRRPHREATLKTPLALTLHPSFPLWLRVEDFDLGPTAFLGFFLLYPYWISFPNQKSWPRWNQVTRLAPFLPLRPLSAGRWYPAPPEGWWCSPSPTHGVRRRGAPGPCGPMRGVTAEYPGLPPMACPKDPAVCPVKIQQKGTLELLFLSRSN